MNKALLIGLLIVTASFITGIILYPQMPSLMASHWNVKGEVDGYMNKFWGLFLMPIISALMLLLFVYIPRIDPLKENIKKFRNYFNNFIILIITFFAYLYLLTIIWSHGITFNIIAFLMPAFSILFYYIGILIEHAKMNWFIGIRTPWTLSDEGVWNRTHKKGGLLFKLTGLITLLGLLLPDYAFIILLAPLLSATVYLIVYSYLDYKKVKQKRKA